MSSPDLPIAWNALLRDPRVTHVEQVPARRGEVVDWPAWVSPVLVDALAARGIPRPWAHQAEAMEAAHRGEHVVLATGTASGKSLGYQVPVLDALLTDAPTAGPRGATALYISPTKALAADQREHLERLALPGVRVAVYDGDTPTDERRWIRDHARLVLTNPDLVHHSLLPGHERWAAFLRGLRYVVIDESHTYRGVFGAHVAAVVRRLRRVAAHYGAQPTFLLASATEGDPAGHAESLLGMPCRAVTVDTSPRGPVTFVLWDPGATPGPRLSATTEAAGVLAGLVRSDVQVLAFARSRAGVEALATRARRLLADAPEKQEAVAAYRGGYLPQERRDLERALRAGALRGLAATNALELGVDISSLDAVVMAGWPGWLASFWQQAGRAGRAGERALAILVAADDPLDSYLVHHPERLFGAPVERTVLDPDNPRILGPHLAAAAAELPLTEPDLDLFGPGARFLLDQLTGSGVLRRRPRGWYWARTDRPGDHLSLRGIDEVVTIVEGSTGRVLGTIDEGAAHAAVHTGAVHVHQGQTWVVGELDLEAHTATVVRGDPGWSTQARSAATFALVAQERAATHGPLGVGFGTVRVTSQVTDFLRVLPSGEVLGIHPLSLPARSLTTKGVWWTLTEEALAEAGVGQAAVPGALHAAEHAAISVLPLVATSDRWDVGGVSTRLHPDTGLPTVLVYDGYPGGAGFAERGHDALAEWLTATGEAIDGCSCTSGCPSCVQSPKCGNGNEPLDKAGASQVIRAVLAALAR